MIDPNPIGRGRGRGVRLALVEILVLVALALAPALPSWADGDEAGAAEAAEQASPDYVPCSDLSRVKYPFLSCVRGPSGRPVLAEEGPGMTGARLELRSSFVAGGGGWGASGVE